MTSSLDRERRSMTLFQIVLLAMAGFGADMVNAVAAGGTRRSQSLKMATAQGQRDQATGGVSDSGDVGGVADRSGLVHWPHALVTTAAPSAGRYYGVGIARWASKKAIRAVVVIAGAMLTAMFFLN